MPPSLTRMHNDSRGCTAIRSAEPIIVQSPVLRRALLQFAGAFAKNGDRSADSMNASAHSANASVKRRDALAKMGDASAASGNAFIALRRPFLRLADAFVEHTDGPLQAKDAFLEARHALLTSDGPTDDKMKKTTRGDGKNADSGTL
jgi:hypothetical protein